MSIWMIKTRERRQLCRRFLLHSNSQMLSFHQKKKYSAGVSKFNDFRHLGVKGGAVTVADVLPRYVHRRVHQNRL